MEKTTLKTLVKDIYNDLGRLRMRCVIYMIDADFTSLTDETDDTKEIERVFDKSLIEILTIIESIRTKYQIN